MKKLVLLFALVSSLAYGQTNSYPSSGNVKIFAANEAWSEGVSVISPTGWAGIRFNRNNPLTGNYSGSWALGFNAFTGNDFSISTNYSGTQYDGLFHISNSTRNVGVGTTSPEGKFTISQPGNGWYDGLRINRDVSNYLTLTEDVTDIRLKNWGAGGIRFYTSSIEAATILNNGNFGIGTSSPQAKLHVAALDESINSAIAIRQSNAEGFGFDIGLDQTINGNMFLYRVSGNVRYPVMEFNRDNGNIAINHSPVNGFALAIGGKTIAESINIKLQSAWPDYVFEKDYPLPSLEQIKSYIDQNKHLPEVPSAKEMEANGVNVGEMNMLLLKKVEELTLYNIEQNEKIKLLEGRLNKLESKQ